MPSKHFSKDYIFARLGSLGLFWRSRNQLSMLNFKKLKVEFRLSDNIKTFKTNTSIVKALSKDTVFSIIVAVITAFLLYWLELNFWVISKFPLVWDSFIGHYLRLPINVEAYTQMLSTVAGITGVFLGLYFTAVSTVIANAYSSVTGDVRRLILEDRLGNVYVKLVAYLTALSVVLLAFSAVGISVLHLAIPLVVTMSLLAIFAFVRLGRNTFFLSDPTLFFNTLSYDLLKWAKLSTYRGMHWKNAGFQDFYRKQAYRSAATLVALVKISSGKQELEEQSLPRLVQGILLTVGAYIDEKCLIPSDSSWFGKKYSHKQWYLTDSTSEVELATQTDTTLRPNEIPDDTWLEDMVLNAVFNVYYKDIKANNYSALYKKITGLPAFFSKMGEKWFIDEGISWVQELTERIINSKTKSEVDTNDKMELSYAVSTVDILASLPLSIELGFMAAVRNLDIENLQKQLVDIKWSNPQSPYRFPLPPDTVKSLEKINDGAIFEKLARSPHKTQEWYVVEYTFNNIEWALFRQWNSIMELLEVWYCEAGKKLADAKKFKHSAAVYTRALEQTWKLGSHIEELRFVAEALRKDAKLDFEKPEWDWEKEQKRINKLRDNAIDGMAKLIPHLWPDKPSDPDMPDFFGGAVHRMGEACFEALAEGDVNKFKTLFRSYFLGILGVFESIRPQVKNWEASTALTWMAEPIIDLLDLSGYAYILSEYHNQPELWEECKQIWDNYLKMVPTQAEPLAGLLKHNKNLWGVITPRANLRSRWQINLAKLLSDLPRRQTDSYYSRPSVVHASEFIRNIAPDEMLFMFVNANEVFVVKYFLEREDTKTLDFDIREDKVAQINRHQEASDE